MKIAVINETSAADRNAEILAALEGRGHEVINAGISDYKDGPTHFAVNDIALMRAMPNMVVLAPADNREAAKMVKVLAKGNMSIGIAFQYELIYYYSI